MAEGQIGKGRGNTVVSVKSNAVAGQKRKSAPEETEKADGGKDKKTRRGKKVKR